jgi:two-component system response regulator FixJ
MKAGAVDFIQKPLDEHRLVMAVMNALKSHADQGTEAERVGDDLLSQPDRMASLSRREADVLEQIVCGKQNREIAEALYISVKTVEFHRANIRKKLGVSSLPDLFRLVFGKQ